MERQIGLTALQVGEAMMGSLRHAMLTNDPKMLAQELADMGGMENIERVQIIDLDGQVRVSSHTDEVGTIWHPDDLACVECHQFPRASRPRTAKITGMPGLLRISTPIPNAPECAGCHPREQNAHLGVLLVDVSVIDVQEHLNRDLWVSLAISTAATLFIILYVYAHIHWVIIRRVEAFRRPLADYAASNFVSRLPAPRFIRDEISDLGDAFNRMADDLDHHAREEAKRSQLRQQAIAEERGRIARELHDGVAQLLGFVNTKAIAIRLLLQNHDFHAAEEEFLQFEEAAQHLFADVREAILGLKMAGQITTGLVATLRDYTTQFSRLSNLPIELAIAPEVETLHWAPETEVQALRIVQGALHNIRRHASATNAFVGLQVEGQTLQLTIADDGRGFDPVAVQADSRPHFGLATMRERAEAVGGAFALETAPGEGTRIMATLPLLDEENHPHDNARIDRG